MHVTVQLMKLRFWYLLCESIYTLECITVWLCGGSCLFMLLLGLLQSEVFAFNNPGDRPLGYLGFPAWMDSACGLPAVKPVSLFPFALT
jgi:hypothetical protein